ncbi:hypothetical protein DID76_00405 [Candidatus Marinamargulisbacteria bacterium SCGC AG-414-C22]|nr:hypothetical protein DID76_00405 [Candidatus Marinamargulisbacteria bacterium SCGC AG-414-C22]
MKKQSAWVGFFIVVVLLTTSLFMFWQSNITRRFTGYTIVGRFEEIAGLIRGSEIRYRGFRVGNVKKITPFPQYIDVEFWINGDIDITKGSQIKIMFDGLVGENYLSIVPNLDSRELIDDNDILYGRSASDLAHFIDLGRDNLVHTEIIFKTIADLVSDVQLNNDIREIFSNINKITNDTASVMETTKGYNFDDIISNLTILTNSMRDMSADLKALNIDESVQQILLDADQISSRFSNLSAELNNLVNKDNIRKVTHTLENLEQASAGLNSMFGSAQKNSSSILKTVLNSSLSNETGIFYNLDQSDAYYDSVFYTRLHKFSIIAGLNNRQGSAKLDQIQQGYDLTDRITTRVGVYQHAAAIGIDYKILNKSSIHLDLYDFENSLFEVSVEFPLIDKLNMSLDYYKSLLEDNNFNLGIKYKL